MPAEAEKPKRRVLLGCAVALIVLVVTAGIVLTVFAGAIQRGLVASTVADLLLARVSVEHARVYPTLRIDQLVVQDSNVSEETSPAISAEHIEAEYALFPEDGRHVDRFTVEGLVLRLLRDREGQRNFAFIQDFLNAPASDDPLAFLPRKIALAPLEIYAGAPDWMLSLQGLSVTGTLPAEDQADLRVQADPVQGHWQLQGVTDERPLAGNIELKVTRAGAEAAFDGKVQLEDLASVDARVEAQLADVETAFAVDLREARLTQAIWGRLLRDLADIPLDFKSLELTSGDLKGVYANETLREATVAFGGSATGLTFGDVDAPLYHGDATVELDGKLGDAESTLQAALSLEPGGTLKVDVTGEAEALTAKIETGIWRIDAMRAALPEDLRGTLDAWPALAALQLTGDVQRTDNDLNGAFSLAPQLHEAAGKVPAIESVWSATLDEEAPADSAFDVMLKATGAGSARIEAAGVEGKLSRLLLHLEETPLSAWYRVWRGEGLGTVDAILSGDITAGAMADGRAPIDFNLQGNLSGVGTQALPLTLSGKSEVDLENASVRDAAANVDLGDLGKLSLKNAAFTMEPANARGALNVELDLDYAGPAFSMPEIHGLVTATATLGWDGKKIMLANLKATGETLGYGDLFLPYGTESEITGTVTYDPDESRVSITPLNIALMDGTSIQAGRVVVGDTTEADSLTLNTDLYLLVAREYLAGVDANLDATLSNVKVTDDRMQAKVVAILEGPSLILPNTLSTLRDVKANLDFSYDNGMDGGGSLSLGELEVAGTILRDLNSEIVCKGHEITLKGLRTKLFAGDIAATIVANLDSSDLAATIEASGEQIDLKVFTEEFEPPQVELTGKVHGSVTASLTPTGITAMEVDLESTEGFSVNREVVEDLLKSQQSGGMSDRVMNKVMNKMLGDKPQRPFDRAALNLTLQDDGRVGGEARLESSDLNLTVAIAADPEAILAALRARQEES